MNKFGNGEAKEAHFPFEVRAPFWEHPIFYALVLALVAGTFYLIFNYRYQQKLRLLRLREHIDVYKRQELAAVRFEPCCRE